MASIETGPRHHSISFVVSSTGKREHVLTVCHCTFGENHFADPGDPRPADDLEITSVSVRAIAA